MLGRSLTRWKIVEGGKSKIEEFLSKTDKDIKPAVTNSSKTLVWPSDMSICPERWSVRSILYLYALSSIIPPLPAQPSGIMKLSHSDYMRHASNKLNLQKRPHPLSP